MVWNNNLTQAQSKAIERLQIVGIKIILGKDCPRKEDGHIDYEAALTLCQLDSLILRRNNRMLSFGKKCINHPSLSRLFPLNPVIHEDPHQVRNRELFQVNHARTVSYQNSAIPAIQRQLNQFYSYSPPPTWYISHISPYPSYNSKFILHTMIAPLEANVFAISTINIKINQKEQSISGFHIPSGWRAWRKVEWMQNVNNNTLCLQGHCSLLQNRQSKLSIFF